MFPNPFCMFDEDFKPQEFESHPFVPCGDSMNKFPSSEKLDINQMLKAQYGEKENQDFKTHSNPCIENFDLELPTFNTSSLFNQGEFVAKPKSEADKENVDETNSILADFGEEKEVKKCSDQILKPQVKETQISSQPIPTTTSRDSFKRERFCKQHDRGKNAFSWFTS